MKTYAPHLSLIFLSLISGQASADATRAASLTFAGSYPDNYIPMPDGALAFRAYGADGNQRVLHVLDGPTLRRTIVLPRDRRVSALNDRFIVAAFRGFEILDANSAARINKKIFERFAPPSVDSRSHWLDDDILTLIRGEEYGTSSLRRVRLPQLEVIERFDAPVNGAYVRWRDKIVTVGYWYPENRPVRPSIVVLDRAFRIIARSDIEPSRPRGHSGCSESSMANPLVVGDSLIYGSGCGGMRVFDLKNMREVASRGPLSDALWLRFVDAGGRLLAVGTGNDSAVVDEIEVPSLRPTRLLRVSGSAFALSGTNLYAIRTPPYTDKSRQFGVQVFDVSRLEPARTLAESLVQAQRLSSDALKTSQDTSAAIAVFRSQVPLLEAGDLRSLTAAALRSVAWYAGLLAQSPDYTMEATALFDGLRAAAPRDEAVLALAKAAEDWIATLNATRVADPLPAVRSTISTGSLGGPIAISPDVVVTSRWCESVDLDNRSQIPEPPKEPGSAAAAFAGCVNGEVMLAVHDARDLAFKRFIPIILSEATNQEHIDAMLLFGSTAVVSIAGRYEGSAPYNLVSVDLESGEVLARSNLKLQTDQALTKAVGCLGMSCQDLNPRTLTPGRSPVPDAAALRGAARASGFAPVESAFVFSWRDNLLEARSTGTGELVCAWSGLLPGRAQRLVYNPRSNSLVVTGSSDSLGRVEPSVAIPVPQLLSVAETCGRRTAKTKVTLDRAMNRLQD